MTGTERSSGSSHNQRCVCLREIDALRESLTIEQNRMFTRQGALL
jgi:hypothetical protein